MSVDTVKRIDDYVASAASGLDGYIIVSDAKNENLRPQMSGPWMKVFIEISGDDNTSFGNEDTCAEENGIITFEINDRIGVGDRNLYSMQQMYDDLRDAFLGSKLIKSNLRSTGTEKGIIHFIDISQSDPVLIDSSKESRMWRRKRVFISYRKLFNYV